MAYDAGRGVTVMFGGETTAGTLGQTWEYDGWSWTQMPLLPTRPSARSDAAMAYDAGHRRIILFGGTTAGSAFDNETWAYDGMSWTLVASGPSAPPGRSGAMLAYDATRDRIVLFGGLGGAGDLADTWELSAGTWSEVTPASSPTGRSHGALAYDAAHARIVLFGGVRSPSAPIGDTWSYDGTTWTDLQPGSAPSARADVRAVYDARRETVVVFGGRNDPVLYDDTWELDDATWSQLASFTNPGARGGAALAYDLRRGQVVMFGGYDFDYAGETWELGFAPSDTIEACDASVDYDADGKLGCADDDCWGVCTPMCGPEPMTCTLSPRCGDGICDPAEAAACPDDC
jgi:hypothetical protein